LGKAKSPGQPKEWRKNKWSLLEIEKEEKMVAYALRPEQRTLLVLLNLSKVLPVILLEILVKKLVGLLIRMLLDI
jgi:hypothetical protein